MALMLSSVPLQTTSLLWAYSVRPYNRLQDRANLERWMLSSFLQQPTSLLWAYSVRPYNRLHDHANLEHETWPPDLTEQGHEPRRVDVK